MEIFILKFYDLFLLFLPQRIATTLAYRRFTGYRWYINNYLSKSNENESL